MFEMHLDNTGRVPTVTHHRWLEGNGANRGVAPPVPESLATLSGSASQVVERVIPASIVAANRIEQPVPGSSCPRMKSID
jgi:hypothetical protein